MAKMRQAIMATAVGLLIHLPATAADKCVDEAGSYVNTKHRGHVALAQFYRPDLPPIPIGLARACVEQPCVSLYFAADPRGFTLPEGQVPSGEFGTAAEPRWRAVPTTATSNCPGLKMLTLAEQPDSTGASMRTEGNGTNPTAPGEVHRNLALRGSDLRQDLETYHLLRQSQSARGAPGTAQGLEAVTSEALQILGQIVADRASAEAYRLLKHKLQGLLGCGDDAPAPAHPLPADPQASHQHLPKPSFPATCRVLRPLRLQDVANSRDALFGAVAQDGVAYLELAQASLSPKEKMAEQVGAAAIISAVIVPIVVRPQLVSDNAQARAIVGTLQSFVDRHWDSSKLTQGAHLALAAGVLAYTRCVDETAKVPNGKLLNCDFSAYADRYTGDRLDVQVAARALAAHLMAVATATNASGQPDALQRVTRAVDALYGSACMLLEAPEDRSPVRLQCPSAPDRIDLGAPLPPSLWLSLSQPIIDAALARDSVTLVSSVAHAVALFSDAEQRATHHRAFLVLGSLMQYAATTGGAKADDAKALHEQRTKILQSLTEDMSDRTLRDGDNIWSIGGSLRAVAGVRMGKASPALLSPLGLPLGIGFDHVAKGHAAGFHFELSPVDLGQYVTFDNQAVVKEPGLADAFSPSITVGASWGRSMPLVVGATLGYSPNAYLDASQAVRGSVNAGLVVGIYVPLIDMN